MEKHTPRSGVDIPDQLVVGMNNSCIPYYSFKCDFYFDPRVASTNPKRNTPATKNIIIKLHSVLSETGSGPLSVTTRVGRLKDSPGESSNGAKATAIT
jgi:hypothetical protein